MTTYNNKSCSEQMLDAAPLPNYTASARDWTEDLTHENGRYHCNCSKCGMNFMGHKRRVVCKLCAAVLEIAAIQQEALKK